jgi:4-hydroxy-tetrahydrodipicolinate reductase
VIRAVVIGATGRMGRALLRAAQDRSDLTIVAAVESASSAALGKDSGEAAGLDRLGVPVSSDLSAALSAADVAIDFSSAHATLSNLTSCRNARKPLLIGTTGFADELAGAFDAAAVDIPLLVAPNTSVGVTLLIELVRDAARALPAEFDIEIVESHHRMKRDAPSGTALALGRAAAEGRQQTLDGGSLHSHTDGHPRRPGEIGFAVVRGGDIVGDHTVLFAGNGETVSLNHQATDRAIFARGALQAAAWLSGQRPGRYRMRDLFSYKVMP